MTNNPRSGQRKAFDDPTAPPTPIANTPGAGDPTAGAVGTAPPDGVTGVEARDSGPGPTAFTARTWKVYAKAIEKHVGDKLDDKAAAALADLLRRLTAA